MVVARLLILILYDVASTGKFKVVLFKKTVNGVALRKIASQNGVHKLPYRCTVYSDGCGSMVHVEIAAVTMGLQHAYILPHEQSLNEAEKICFGIWGYAAALTLRAVGAHPKLFNEAVDYALYVDLRMASTASRQHITPLEIIRGTVPDISKLHCWYNFICSFVNIPRQKRKELASFIGRSEVGRLMGFKSPFLLCFGVLLSKTRMADSINVTFDDSNCTKQKSRPSVPPQPKELQDIAVIQEVRPAVCAAGENPPSPNHSFAPSGSHRSDASPASSNARSPYVAYDSLFGSWSPHVSISPFGSQMELASPSQLDHVSISPFGSPSVSQNPVY